MASLAVVTPIRAQVLPPDSPDLQTLDFEVRSAARAYQKSSMRIAFFGFRLRFMLQEDWSPLGYDNEEDYRASLGLAQSTYYRLLRVGQVLHRVSLADLEQIGLTNADMLVRVNPVLWCDFNWVEEAKRLNSAQLANLIVQRHRQLGSDREPMTTYSVRVPFTAKQFLQETVEKFRQENGLKSAGEALELLVADVHDRPNVMMAVKRAHTYVEWARFKFRKLPGAMHSAEIQWLIRAQRLLYKAYWAVRTSHAGDIHEEDAKAVYPAESSQDLQDFSEWQGTVSQQPGGESGEEAEDDEGVAEAAGDLREVFATDELAGCEAAR